MSFFKNTAGQRWLVFAFSVADDATANEPVTGDAANITARIRKDYGTLAATNDLNPTEISSTNAPGFYEFTLTQAETNADEMNLFPQSSTANVQVIALPQPAFTRPPNYPDLLISASGHISRVVLTDTLTTYTGNTPQTGDNFPRLGAPAGSSISADIAGVDGKVDTVLNRLGNFTATGINTVLGFFQALMRSDATDPSDLGGSYAAATDSNQAIRDRGDAAWTTGSGLTSQQVRDAMKLSPTPGAPDAGSVDQHLDDIEADVTGLNGDAMRGTDGANTVTPPTAGQNADAVWDEARAGHTAAGSFGEGVASVQGNVTGDVQGNVDGSVASVTAAVTAGTVNDKTGYSLASDIRIKKNTAYNNFVVQMVDTSDSPVTSLTVTAQRSLDGAALVNTANAVTEIGGGLYNLNLAAADTNGDSLALNFTATGAKTRAIMIALQTE